MVTAQQVIDAQVHLWSLKNESHPKTSQYWAEIVNGLVVINPEIIANQINTLRDKLDEAKKEWKEILVVCEKKMYAQDLEDLSKKLWFSFLNYKIPWWFLTNFDTFKKRIDNINEMATFLDSEEFKTLTKKEQLVYKRKFARANKVYKWVTKLNKRPDIVVVIDWTMLGNFLDEAKKVQKLETIVLASTNFPRYRPEDEIVMTNVASHTSIDFVVKNLLS